MYCPEIGRLAKYLQDEKHEFNIDGNPQKRFKSIYDVDNLFRIWSNYVKRESFFNRYPEMTNHGIEHIENVVSIIAQIVLPFLTGSNSKINFLNRSEVFCLAAAGWLHDIGMYVTGKDGLSDDADMVRDIHGRLSMEKIIRERHTLFPGCSEGDVRLIGSILAYHQSKAPLDINAKIKIIKGRKDEEKLPIENLKAQTEVLSEIVTLKTLSNAPMWKKISRNIKTETLETLVTVNIETGEVIKSNFDSENKKNIIIAKKSVNKEWIEWLKEKFQSRKLWKLQYSQDEEYVDATYLSAILAIADQMDVQVARSGNMEFMVRQLDRASYRSETIDREIDKIIGIDINKKEELKIDEIVNLISDLNKETPLSEKIKKAKTRLTKIIDWSVKKQSESGYLKNGFKHFMQNLVIERSLVIKSEVRNKAANKKKILLKPLNEDNSAFPDPLLHIVLIPNRTERLEIDFNRIARENNFNSQIEKIKEKLTKSGMDEQIKAAEDYISKEIKRLNDTKIFERKLIDGKYLSFCVYLYDNKIDSQVIPDQREIFRDKSSSFNYNGQGLKNIERAFIGDLALELSFKNINSPKTVIFYGPHGSGKKIAVHQLAQKLAGIDNNKIFKHEILREDDLDRDIDQITDFIKKLADFMSCNGEFALENMLRDSQLVTEFHKEFAIECIQKSSYNYVICLLEFNRIDKKNREFFKRLIQSAFKNGNQYEKTRILCVSTNGYDNVWTNDAQGGIKKLRFSFCDSEKSQADFDKNNGIKEINNEWVVSLTSSEIETIWKDIKTRVLKIDEKNTNNRISDSLYEMWRSFGYYLIFIDFLNKVSAECDFDYVWFENRLKSAMTYHIDYMTLRYEKSEKEMLAYLSHLVSGENLATNVDEATQCNIKKSNEVISKLNGRAVINLNGDKILLHPAWFRVYSDGDKATVISRFRNESESNKSKKNQIIDADELRVIGFNDIEIGLLMSEFKKRHKGQIIRTKEETLEIARKLKIKISNNKHYSGLLIQELDRLFD
jgi:hypothetical protein